MTFSLPRRLLALAVAGIAVAAAPQAASAQPLNSVAISTSTSNTYQVLDVEGASTQLGAKVIQFIGTGGSNQKWTLSTRADGQQQIANNRSGMCLTTNGVAGSQLYQWTCNGGPRQVWNGDLPGAWMARNKLTNPATGLVVDVAGGSMVPGTRVIGWYDNGGDNQTFGYYQLY